MSKRSIRFRVCPNSVATSMEAIGQPRHRFRQATDVARMSRGVLLTGRTRQIPDGGNCCKPWERYGRDAGELLGNRYDDRAVAVTSTAAERAGIGRQFANGHVGSPLPLRRRSPPGPGAHRGQGKHQSSCSPTRPLAVGLAQRDGSRRLCQGVRRHRPFRSARPLAGHGP
jgi:hypothetical protein